VATNRHWAQVRKTLEQNLLCDSLKGRVRYFATRYRKAHDNLGRVCVLVDDKEILNIPFSVEYKVIAGTYKLDCDRSLGELYDMVAKGFGDQGLFAPWDFGISLDEFLSNSISQSLESSGWIVRMLAIMDRRVGKRTLEKIKPSVASLPEWLQYFYKLRLDSESLLTQ